VLVYPLGAKRLFLHLTGKQSITESKKRFRPDGSTYYEKHKLFLYKEDFEKFAEGLNDVVQFIRNNNINLSSGSESHREDSNEA
jgi:hypothetical protein